MDYICSRCLRPRPPGLYPQQPVPAGAAAAAEPELVRMVFIYLVNDQWLTVTLEVATLFPDGFLLIGGGGGTQLLGYHYPGAWNVAPAPLFIRAWQYDYTYYDQQLPLAYIRCNCPACLAQERQGRG
ncbi:hypothetical protein TYRP_001605 [Tyrophagus putrescentiae]|nr:hypothetical protein TYRP_022382 [Tyrophagus putrescentiae]KAH9400049.1 hypothetical protein TYRP_001605 [Tyrophagus putrescentiae]